MADHPFFAAAYDRLTAPAERGSLGAARGALFERAEGRVLDVGAGTGANMRHYGRGAVTSVVACEPDAAMRRRLERRLSAHPAAVPVTVAAGGIPGLGYGDGAFDTIVCTLVLCTVPDVAGGLAELRRLLRPGGRLLFLEHVRARGALGRVQDIAAPAWQRLCAGCHLDRDTIGAMRNAAFTIADCVRPPLIGGAAQGVIVVGSAVRRESPQ